jgi:hypothetical protein
MNKTCYSRPQTSWIQWTSYSSRPCSTYNSCGLAMNKTYTPNKQVIKCETIVCVKPKQYLFANKSSSKSDIKLLYWMQYRKHQERMKKKQSARSQENKKKSELQCFLSSSQFLYTSQRNQLHRTNRTQCIHNLSKNHSVWQQAISVKDQK